MVMLVATQACAMAIPRLFARAIDGMGAQAPAAMLRGIAVQLAALALGGMVFRLLSRVFILFAARDVEMDIRCHTFGRLMQLDGAFFAAHPAGDLISRMTNDLTQVRLMLGPGLLNVVNTAIAYVAAVPLMLAISAKLTLWAFAIYPAGVLGMRAIGRRLFAQNRRQQEALGRLTSFLQESIAGHLVLRAFAIEGEWMGEFRRHNAANLAANAQLSRTRALMSRYSVSLASLATLATVWVGAVDVLAGRLSVGELVAMVEYMALLAWPTFALGWVSSLWQRGRASMQRIAEVSEATAAIVSGPLAPAALAAELVVTDLTVTRGQAKAALAGISLRVPAGTTLGIVGPIGGGKTTLLRALLRLEVVGPGQILLGGVDICALQLEVLRAQVGFVPQNPTLLSMTLAENIAFGAPGASRAQIAAAAAEAGLQPDIAALPQGLDTPVGERGVSLSGGQKQRAALARAWLRQPAMLVLDDAFSAVDVATESTVLANLRRLQAGRTTLIAAHRLSAVAHADWIVVLAGGAIVEGGTPAALAGADGPFAALARAQALAAVEDA